VRLLVLDQTHILPWIVERELPEWPHVEVVAMTRVEDAERLLREAPPDAAVVSLPPAEVDWRRFYALCRRRRPPVPVLFESCIERALADLGLDPGSEGVMLLQKPVPAAALREALCRLFELAGQVHGKEPVAVPFPIH